MGKAKIGFHVANPCGGCGGIGDYFKKLEDAQVPFGVYAVDSGGVVGVDAVKYRHADPIIYRDSRFDVLPYHMAPEVAARANWPRMKAGMPPEVTKNKSRIWYETGNEPSKEKHEAEWLGHYLFHIALQALQEGYKICGPGWAAGTPEAQTWYAMGWEDYLNLCEQFPDRVAVTLHEYSYSLDILKDENGKPSYPYQIGRYQALLKACDSLGIKHPTIFITETGWTLDAMPPDPKAKEDIRWLTAFYDQSVEVDAAFLWTLQNGAGNGNLPWRLNALIDWLADWNIQYTEEHKMPDKVWYKSKPYLLPQNTSKAELLSILDDVLSNRRTLCFSHDDAIRLVNGAAEGSLVIAYNVDRWPEEVKAALEEMPHEYRSFPVAKS